MNERLPTTPQQENAPEEPLAYPEISEQGMTPEENPDIVAGVEETEELTGPSEAELQRREGTAQVAGEILTGVIRGQGGFFEQTPDPFAQAMEAALMAGAARVQEGLRSADPAKRAKATNFMREVNQDITSRMSAEAGKPAPEVTPAQELNRYAFAPAEAKTLMEELQEEPGQDSRAEKPTDVEDGEMTPLTPEETIIAKEVAHYADAVAEKAEESGLLVRGDHIFGAETEASFGDYISSKEDAAFDGLSEEERRKAVADAFAKLRKRAYRRLQIGKQKKAPAKKHKRPLFDLAA